MFLAYRGYTVLLLAPLMAALAVILSGDVALLLPIYTETFMRALGNYILAFSRCSCWALCWPADGRLRRGHGHCQVD